MEASHAAQPQPTEQLVASTGEAVSERARERAESRCDGRRAGPIRYAVERYDPGRLVRFAFASGGGLVGWHELGIRPAPGAGVLWRHVLSLTDPPRAATEVVLPLHDALVEDLLDAVVSRLGGTELVRRPLTPTVRVLRPLLGARDRLDRFHAPHGRASMAP